MMTTTRRSPRYSIRDHGRTVSLATSDADVMAALGEWASDELFREYTVVGQSVYEITAARPGSSGQQVCERLSHHGNTLWATRETLARVIRRELAAAIRRYEREQGR